jgi:hypothetical protein
MASISTEVKHIQLRNTRLEKAGANPDFTMALVMPFPRQLRDNYSSANRVLTVAARVERLVQGTPQSDEALIICAY